MAWIESHQSLKDHPKLFKLCSVMQWDQDMAIGKMQRFWWWCLDYALDGNLENFNDSQIALGMGVAISQAKQLVEAMVQARWLDRKPYFRVHDWWTYTGRFIQIKYKNSPECWRRIKDLYVQREQLPLELPQGVLQDTEPNQPNQPNQPSTAHFVHEIYEAYPRKVSKPEALKAIKKAMEKLDPAQLLEKTKRYATAVSTEEKRFVPHPATWFNQERFNDPEVEWNPKENDLAKKPKKIPVGSTMMQ
jgi:hypothetical protein